MSDSIAHSIDHAVLHPTQTEQDLREACRLGLQLQVASVCVKPYLVPLAADLLGGSPVKVSTVISFPHGACRAEQKVGQAHDACRAGAVELDMVANLGKVFAGEWAYVQDEMASVVAAAAQHQAIVKVILETGLLVDDQQKIELCRCCETAGAAFVKTSTGFGYVPQPDGTVVATGATFADVALLRATCSEKVGIKASGGIRTLQVARRFLELGATRLGTSATQALVDEERGSAISPADQPPD